MIELQKIKSTASAILSVLFGVGSLASLWLAMYSVWPMVIGFVVVTFIQLFISIWYLAISSQSGRAYVDINSVEKKDSNVSRARK